MICPIWRMTGSSRWRRAAIVSKVQRSPWCPHSTPCISNGTVSGIGVWPSTKTNSASGSRYFLISHAEAQRSTWTFLRVQYRILFLASIQVVQGAHQRVQAFLDGPLTCTAAVCQSHGPQEGNPLPPYLFLDLFQRACIGHTVQGRLNPFEALNDFVQPIVCVGTQLVLDQPGALRQERPRLEQMSSAAQLLHALRNVLHVLHEIGACRQHADRVLEVNGAHALEPAPYLQAQPRWV